jgi:hypothetical protein
MMRSELSWDCNAANNRRRTRPGRGAACLNPIANHPVMPAKPIVRRSCRPFRGASCPAKTVKSTTKPAVTSIRHRRRAHQISMAAPAPPLLGRAQLPAISYLGAFQTPAVRAREWLSQAGVRKSAQ